MYLHITFYNRFLFFISLNIPFFKKSFLKVHNEWKVFKNPSTKIFICTLTTFFFRPIYSLTHSLIILKFISKYSINF